MKENENFFHDKYGYCYYAIFKNKNPIIFNLSEGQKQKFYKHMSAIWKEIVDDETTDFMPNLYRHGVMMFRIAMILTVIREKENILGKDTIVCNNRDFLVSLKLTKTLLRHSENVFDSMDDGNGLSKQDEEFLQSLPNFFERKNAIEAGILLNIPKRTIDDKLSKWKAKKIVQKLSTGKYKKL